MIQASYTIRHRVDWRFALRTTLYAVTGLLTVALTGCSTSYLATSAGYATTSTVENSETNLVEESLRAAEADWRGTPYRYGGTSRKGIDCSAFVMTVYQDVFDLSLPRTTTAQVEVGEAVSPKALQAGDLVFFRTSRKTRHVGIYLGDGEFAHASTSQGVMTSHLDNDYWQRTYWTARRILPTAFAETATERPSRGQKIKPASTRRTGW